MAIVMIGHGLYLAPIKTTHQNITNWQVDQETIKLNNYGGIKKTEMVMNDD